MQAAQSSPDEATASTKRPRPLSPSLRGAKQQKQEPQPRRQQLNARLLHRRWPASVSALAPAPRRPHAAVWRVKPSFVTVKKHGKDVKVTQWRVDLNGDLFGGCYHTCKNQYVRMSRFAPEADECNLLGLSALSRALAKFKEAHQARDQAEAEAQLKIIKDLRCGFATSAARRNKLSPRETAVQGLV